jgi:hypothetical protein
MFSLKEIEDTIAEWEDEAEEAVKEELDIQRMKELSQAIDEHIQEHHSKEIEDIIRELTERQAGIFSDHDELTSESQKEDDIQQDEAIDELLDKLRQYQK